MNNIKKALKKQYSTLVGLTIEEYYVKDCLNNFLKKEFDLDTPTYYFSCSSEDSDLLDINFKDFDVADIIEEKYPLNSDLIGQAILSELGADCSETIGVYCPNLYSTEYLMIMISPHLINNIQLEEV